jgi:hypothetical protein
MDKLNRLMAVNMIIRTAGEAPVNSLNAATNDTLVAQQVLDEHTLRWLTANHLTTTTYTDTWVPDDQGFITLPAGSLFVDPTDAQLEYTHRGSNPVRLWNVTDNTYVFTESVELKVVVGESFDNLPVASQLAIVDSSRIEYQMLMQGNADVNVMLVREAMTTKAQARNKDLQEKGRTLFDNPNSNSRRWGLLRTLIGQRGT